MKRKNKILMFDFIKDIFRRRFLKRAASGNGTRLLPLSAIRSVTVILDTDDPSYTECKEAVLSFFRQNNIKVSIWFLDFAKKSSDERQTTSLSNTITAKDLNWWGRPSVDKIAAFSEEKPDMLISLAITPTFTSECLAACSKAGFKIGRHRTKGRIFDLMIEDSPSKSYNSLEAFNAIKDYINTIQ